MVFISCIVPTLNRHEDIVRLAQSFSNVKKEESIKFQLILVDNSHDGNAKAIYETLDFGCDSIYVHEPKPGLSNARNAALAFIGDSEFVCTIDDDIIVPEDFLTRLHSTILKYSDAVIIGGRVELYNSKDLPVTIKTSQEEAIYDGFPLFGFVFGCAMVIKASVFKDIGIFDPNLGAGTKNGGSEDADFLYRAWMFYNKKCSIVYAPHYYVYHNHGRREPSYTNQLQINYAKGQGGFYYKHIVQHKSLYILKCLWWDILADFQKQDKKSLAISRYTKWKNRMKGAYYYLKS